MSVEVEPKTSNDLFERGPKKVLDESTRAVIKRLHEKEGKGIRELARDFSVSRNTIKRCLNGSYVKNRKKSPNQMFLQKHYEQIKQMYYEHEGFCIPLQRTIKERFKFDIGLRMLERFCQPFRKALKNETAQRNRAIRFETQPGDQMQIDYGEKDLILGGKRTRIYFFVSKLGYSRRIFAKAYLNKKEASWLDGIESAFHYFGGGFRSLLCPTTTEACLGLIIKKTLRHLIRDISTSSITMDCMLSELVSVIPDLKEK